MEKKYKLTDETKKVNGHVLHKIEAIRDFGDVNKGDKGGWVEKEENLSHEGKCWVDYNAMVYGNAMVSGNAWVYGNASVYDNAEVSDEARIYGEAKVFGDAVVYGHARVYDYAEVSDKAKVFDYAMVSGIAVVYGNANVFDNVWVYGEAEVGDNAMVFGKAQICGNAQISKNEDYCVIKNFWSSGRYFTYTRSNKKWKVGCFYGTGEELMKKAYKESEKKGKCYEATVKYIEEIVGYLK